MWSYLSPRAGHHKVVRHLGDEHVGALGGIQQCVALREVVLGQRAVSGVIPGIVCNVVNVVILSAWDNWRRVRPAERQDGHVEKHESLKFSNSCGWHCTCRVFATYAGAFLYSLGFNTELPATPPR